MEAQQLLNVIMGAFLMVLGWLLNELWSAHKELAKSHHEHVKEVAESYVTKDDLREQLNHIRTTCDNIWKAIRKEDR